MKKGNSNKPKSRAAKASPTTGGAAKAPVAKAKKKTVATSKSPPPAQRTQANSTKPTPESQARSKAASRLPPVPPILLQNESEIPEEPIPTAAIPPQDSGDVAPTVPTIPPPLPPAAIPSPVLLPAEPAETLQTPGVAAQAQPISETVSDPLQRQVSHELALPKSYGIRCLWTVPTDPFTLHVSWDFSPEQRAVIHTESLGAAWRLRIYLDDHNGAWTREIQLDDGQTEYFASVPNPASRYLIELGYEDIFGDWIVLAKSEVSTPSAAPAVNSPQRIEFASMVVTPAAGSVGSESEPQTARPLPIPVDFNFLRETLIPHDCEAGWVLSSTDTSEKPAGNDSTGSVVQQTSISNPSSADILALLEGRSEASEGGRSGNAPHAIRAADATSPAEGPGLDAAGAGPRRGFWMQVNAEVVVYGATEPDALVTFAGRHLKLRPDGTFTLRFALPDGAFILPISATSADGSDLRWAELVLSRKSEYAGSVGAVPQDPDLKPPG